MNLCLPIGFSSLLLVFINHGQAMAVNRHLLCCLCRVIFHFHLPEFPRKHPSSCTWFFGMLPQFVRCRPGLGQSLGGRFLFPGLHFHGHCWQTTSIHSSLPRNTELPFPRITQPVEEVSSGGTQGDAVEVWSWMDKAGRFFPPQLSAVASCWCSVHFHSK